MPKSSRRNVPCLWAHIRVDHSSQKNRPLLIFSWDSTPSYPLLAHGDGVQRALASSNCITPKMHWIDFSHGELILIYPSQSFYLTKILGSAAVVPLSSPIGIRKDWQESSSVVHLLYLITWMQRTGSIRAMACEVSSSFRIERGKICRVEQLYIHSTSLSHDLTTL